MPDKPYTIQNWYLTNHPVNSSHAENLDAKLQFFLAGDSPTQPGKGFMSSRLKNFNNASDPHVITSSENRYNLGKPDKDFAKLMEALYPNDDWRARAESIINGPAEQ